MMRLVITPRSLTVIYLMYMSLDTFTFLNSGLHYPGQLCVGLLLGIACTWQYLTYWSKRLTTSALAYRLNVILYPSDVFVQNTGVTALAAFPHYHNIALKGFLPVGPELKNR